MGRPFSKPQVIPKVNPKRSFSAIADDMENTVKVLKAQLIGVFKTENVDYVMTIHGDYLLGIDDVYYKVDILKQSAGNQYQATITIK